MPTATILQIIPRLDTGGAELATVEITEAVVAAGGEALVASEGGRLGDELASAGGELIEFPAASKNPVQLIRNINRLSAIICERQVDLVHARSRAPAWSALFAARRTGRPFVTTYHGAYGNKGPFKSAYNSVMARGDIVIANSYFTADLIRTRHRPSDDRVRIVYRGIDFTKFDPALVSNERVELLRQSWGVNPDDRIVLQAARLTGWKGQHVVLEAAGLLAAAGGLNRVVFILAGDIQGREAYQKELEQKIKTLGLEHHVRIVGHCDDIPAAFRAAHVAVVASTEPEAFGRAAAEAEALACPVIVTDLGAAPETVNGLPYVAAEEATGWRVPPGEPEPLAEALEEVLNMPNEARLEMGHRARNHVINRFSLENMKYNTLTIYDELIGSRLTQIYFYRLGLE